jgi:hypothetical protein
MRNALVAAVAVVMLLLAVRLTAQRRGGGGGSVTFAIAVSDPSGAPVPDVKVTLTGAAQRTVRTEAGRAVFEGLPAGTYRFRFEKEGFVPLEREMAGRGSAPIDVKVTLLRAAAPVPPPSPVPPLPAAPVNPGPLVLDLPAFIEKNYVGKAPAKSLPLACSAGGIARLLQVNEPIVEHSHPDADEFIYVIAGQGTARFGNHQEPLDAGVFVVIPRGTSHAFGVGPKKPLVLLSTRAGEQCAG